MEKRVIAIGVDHGGILLKQVLIDHLSALGHSVLDLGTHGTESVDYPDFAFRVADAIRAGSAELGVVVCGTGIGMSIAINRYPWIRAGVCHDATSARLCREHNDANVMALGARLIGSEVALECLTVFLNSEFTQGRHARRVAKLGNPPDLAATTHAA